jgi:uncharacterized protein
MATRRREVWLATKIPDRKRDDFLRRLEGSLKRLQVDQVDLVHIHSLGHADDLRKIEAPDGALKGLLEAREQKMARFIGMTSHTNGEVMARPSSASTWTACRWRSTLPRTAGLKS